MAAASRPWTDGPFVAGDWGTSNLRLFLCTAADGGEPTVQERRDGPGVAQAGDHGAILLDLVRPWRDRHGPLPILLCGMVGSSIGWREVPYVDCPTGLRSLAGRLTRFMADDHPVAIVPGLACTGPRGAPDVMRGEETQILGALAMVPELAQGTHLLCLPGTHTKWVALRDGRIETFVTGLAGELFDLLRRHSVLVRGAPAEATGALDTAAFDLGLERADGGLLHALFETRSRQLRAGMDPGAAVAFLSGLVIGTDVTGGLAAFPDTGDAPVTVIGTPALAAHYDRAFRRAGRGTRALDGAALSLAGLGALARGLATEQEAVP